MVDESLLADMAADAENPELDTGKMELLQALAQEQFDKEAEKKRLEQQAEDLGKEISDIAVNRIPALAAELGVSDLTMANGLKVTIGPVYALTLPKQEDAEAREAAFAHLREIELGGLVKNQVIASFEKGDDEKAQELLEELRDQGFMVAQKEDVHYSTLNAALRTEAARYAEEGKPFPLDPTKFGGFAGVKSTVKQPKSKK